MKILVFFNNPEISAQIQNRLNTGLSLLFKCKCINKSMILHNIHVIIIASTLLALYLFISHPCIFFIFHQIVRKPLNLLIMISKRMKVL